MQELERQLAESEEQLQQAESELQRAEAELMQKETEVGADYGSRCSSLGPDSSSGTMLLMAAAEAAV